MSVQGATGNFRPWSAEDNEKLKAGMANGVRVSQLAKELGRTTAAVFHRTRRLGILRNRPWSTEDDRRLANLWGEYSLHVIAEKMARTPAAIYFRAQHAVKLPLGCAHGLEYLWTAAVRTGFPVASLRMILKWAGVRLHVAMARPTKAKRHFHTVDPIDVDDAIERWLKTETLAAAAARHGIHASTLERLLLRAKPAELPPKPDRKKRWRVPSEVVDKVLAARAA